jgi:hypothetical protein
MPRPDTDNMLAEFMNQIAASPLVLPHRMSVQDSLEIHEQDRIVLNNDEARSSAPGTSRLAGFTDFARVRQSRVDLAYEAGGSKLAPYVRPWNEGAIEPARGRTCNRRASRLAP